MSQPESKLSRDIQAALRLEGYFCFKIHGSEFMQAGLPDIIVCAKGYFIGVEVKMPGKRKNTSPRQDFVREQIKNAEGESLVVTSVKEALEEVAHYLKSRELFNGIW